MMSIRHSIQGAILQAGVWQLFDQDVTQNPLYIDDIKHGSDVINDSITNLLFIDSKGIIYRRYRTKWPSRLKNKGETYEKSINKFHNYAIFTCISSMWS